MATSCSINSSQTTRKVRSNNVKLLCFVGQFAYVAGQRDLSVNTSADTVNVSDKDSGGVAEFIYGDSNTTVSLSGIYIPNDIVLQAFQNAIDNKCLVLIQREVITPLGDVITREGLALVTAFNETASYGDSWQYSVELQVTGAMKAIPVELS